jgi:glycosyltransferase involved in cell wall biosynthesis
MSESLTIAVMAFNEVDSLKVVVDEIISAFQSQGRSFDVLIVDDGSTDGMGELADSLASSRAEVSVIHHDTNLGLGEVYRSAFNKARGDWLTFLPGDGQIPADSLLAFAEGMQDADMVLGYMPDRKVPPWVKMLSWGERTLYRLLFGGFPRFQGAFMFRRSILDEITLTSTGRGWTIVMELILRVHRGNYRVEHSPTRLRPRTHGESKVNNIRNIWSNFRQAVSLWRTIRRD